MKTDRDPTDASDTESDRAGRNDVTIHGVLAGILSPSGAGTALTRAARAQVNGVPAAEPVAAAPCGCGQSDCVRCGASTDQVELTPAARAALRAESASGTEEASPAGTEGAPRAQAGVRGADSSVELSAEEQAEVERLEQRDREVRQHEQAHVASGGAHVRGGPSFEYETGPDGKRYATGGEVQIDTSPVDGDPEATIAKMEQVRAAALAPAEPSSQDRAVAATASRHIQAARSELTRERANGGTSDDSAASASVSATHRETTPASYDERGTVAPRPRAPSALDVFA